MVRRERPLYEDAIVLHVPLSALAACVRWMVTTNHYIHPARVESHAPLTYLLRLRVPPWAMGVCKAIAGATPGSGNHMIQRVQAHQDPDRLQLRGELVVGDKTILATSVTYTRQRGGSGREEVRCDFRGMPADDGRYQGLMATVDARMRDMCVQSERDVERVVRLCGALAAIAVWTSTVRAR